jgi:MoxR-like ATPase
MEEGRVTIDGTEYALAKPFMVFATQNPIEYEGTYPLPEAQLDRFMMKLTVGYPARAEEARIFQNVQNGFDPQKIAEVQAVLTGEQILSAREEVKRVRVEESLIGYILDILEKTRGSGHVLLGASPRAGIALMTAGKVMALMDDRDFCIPEDFQGIAKAALRHRILLTPDAEMEGLTPDKVLDSLISSVAVPR